MKISITIILFLTIGIFTNNSAFGIEISDAFVDLYSVDSQQNSVGVMWLGPHQKGSLEGYASAGIIIKTANFVILIDPSNLLSENLDSLEKIDAVFITHTHGDHFNKDSTVLIHEKTGANIIANPAAYVVLEDEIPDEKLYRILPDQVLSVDGITVESFLAEHPADTPLLYVIEIDDVRIFHGSDSGFVEDLNEIELPVDIALIPVGDPSPTASPNDAMNMIKSTQSKVAIPMHGNPNQMAMLEKMTKESNVKTEIIIPKPLEIIYPSIDFSELDESKLPDWIKNIFVWYGEGQISEGDVLNAITFLVENQIIQIDTANQSMEMMNQGMMKQNMSFNVDVPVIMPMINGYYKGNMVYFVHTEISDFAMAGMMSKMINFPTLYVPELKNISEDQMARVYIFTNGVPGSEPYGGGPFMYQIDVFDSIPGQAKYSQFRIPYLVTWNDDTKPRILTSESAILKAETGGEITIKKSSLVVNAPMISWEMQGNYGKTMEKISMIPRMFESMSGVEGELTFVDENNYVAIFKLHSEQDTTNMMGMNQSQDPKIVK